MLEKLRAELEHYASPPHLLSSGDDGRPHAVATNIAWDGDHLLLSAGKRSLANIAARKFVSVLWCAPSSAAYSLIVDGEAELCGSGEQAQVRLTITRAVLHRPGAPVSTSASGCGSDCVPLFG
jgi:hypothetical protein